jgi:hypothetical protein
MTANEAFNIAVEAVEKKFEETAKKWGFTIKRKNDGESWVCWQIAELHPYEIVSVTKFDAYIRLWRPTNQVIRLFPNISADELKDAVKSFVSRALEKVVFNLTYTELRKSGVVGDVWWTGKALKVEVGSRILFLKFVLGKKFWSWKIALEHENPIAFIRRPIEENPIKGLLDAAKYFSLLAI